MIIYCKVKSFYGTTYNGHHFKYNRCINQYKVYKVDIVKWKLLKFSWRRGKQTSTGFHRGKGSMTTFVNNFSGKEHTAQRIKDQLLDIALEIEVIDTEESSNESEKAACVSEERIEKDKKDREKIHGIVTNMGKIADVGILRE
jgi:hypothetical protein